MKTPGLPLMLGCVLTCCGSLSPAQDPSPRRPGRTTEADAPLHFEGARKEIYKTIGGVELALYVFEPPEHRREHRRPAIVFFFGGGWTGGTPRQFEPQCRYLASRGMVAMTAEYRVFSRHGTRAVKCVEDAKSAVRWVRAHARRLGVDAERIAAGGGSAGGHIAACAGIVPDFDAQGEDPSVSSVPNALVLFNPALVLAPIEGKEVISAERLASLEDRLGTRPRELSPFHHIRSGAPPTLILHGKADDTVPYRTAELFAEAMRTAGNRCALVGYADQGHGFFNFGRGGNANFIATTKEMDKFLASLGWLQGPPTVDKFLEGRAPN